MKKMTPERWKEIEELVDAVMDLDPVARLIFLEQKCTGKESLLLEVKSVFESQNSTGEFLNGLPHVDIFDEENPEQLIGADIGKYRIERFIGNGGFGLVYCAKDKELERFVALKMLYKKYSASDVHVRLFKKEAITLAQLLHPNIVIIYENGNYAHTQFIAMEFVNGETLRRRIETVNLSLEEILRIGIDVTNGLAEAHSNNVTHRDIKPENIIIESKENGLAKILDFGIAKILEEITQESGIRSDKEKSKAISTPFGTIQYMSPEQLEHKSVDSQTDVWSFGVVLYEMAVRKLPFSADSTPDLMNSISNGEFNTLPSDPEVLPKDLADIIKKCLIKDKRRRYQTIREVNQDLTKLHKNILNPIDSNRHEEVQDKMFRHNLPNQVTQLIGRETKIEEAKSLISQSEIRLLTFLGSGGIGKTRMAMRVGKDVIDNFADGVFYMSLETINDFDLVAFVIAQTLNIREFDGKPPVYALIEYLKNKQMLLILDNFEHLISAADLVAELLKSSLSLKVLVTSRFPLNLTGEHQFTVPPLEFPKDHCNLEVNDAMEFSSIALFVQRAQSVKADFTLTDNNAPIVAEICSQLDGLPLAIEIAAARIKIFSPEEMLPRIKQSRLNFLTSGLRDLPSRQQTVRATIAWSYDLLDATEKELFRRLAVFAGGFTLETAESVCNQKMNEGRSIINGVSSLLDKSLLQRDVKSEEDSRFKMLVTIREYGIELLTSSGEIEKVRESYADFFLSMTEIAEPQLKGRNQAQWFQRLEQEHDNLRAVLGWSRDTGNFSVGLRLTAASMRFWEVHGYLTEGRQWIEELLKNAENGEVPSSICAKASNVAGILARNSSDYGEAIEHLNNGLSLFREESDKLGMACSLNYLGLIACDQNRYHDAEKLLQKALVLYRNQPDKHGIAATLKHLGVLRLSQGKYNQAADFLNKSIKISRELGDVLGLASSINNFGIIALDNSDYVQATESFVESQKLFQELKDKLGVGASFMNFGEIAQHNGDFDQAKTLYLQALSLFREVGGKREEATALNKLAHILCLHGDYQQAFRLDCEGIELRLNAGEKASIAYSLEGFARIALSEHNNERAVLLSGAAEGLRNLTKTPLPPVPLKDQNQLVDSIRSILSEELFLDLFERGRCMNLEQAASFAILQNGTDFPAA
jgi:predicted ATPase/Tfp pilus assembly protein PilF